MWNCWLTFSLHLEKPHNCDSNSEDMSRRRPKASKKRSLSELLSLFWLIHFSKECLVCETLFVDLISWDHTRASLKPNCVVPLTETPASLSPNQEHSLFIALSDLMTDMTDSVIAWIQVGFWSLDLFSHLKPHQTFFELFKEDGEYGILSSCALIQARWKEGKEWRLIDGPKYRCNEQHSQMCSTVIFLHSNIPFWWFWNLSMLHWDNFMFRFKPIT